MMTTPPFLHHLMKVPLPRPLRAAKPPRVLGPPGLPLSSGSLTTTTSKGTSLAKSWQEHNGASETWRWNETGSPCA
jgi:hypothetical protein